MNMEPLTIMLFAVGLLQSNSIDLVYDEDVLVDGFININESVMILDSWQRSNNGYFGVTEDGDNFYLIVTSDSLRIKIWTDTEVIRLVEPLI